MHVNTLHEGNSIIPKLVFLSTYFYPVTYLLLSTKKT